jgi:hypothetical protein
MLVSLPHAKILFSQTGFCLLAALFAFFPTWRLLFLSFFRFARRFAAEFIIKLMAARRQISAKTDEAS